MTPKIIWNQITANLQSTISKPEIETWFSSISLLKIEKDLAIIKVPNKFIASWLRDHYIDIIQKSFKQSLNYSPEIRFVYSATKFSENTEKRKTQKQASVSIYHTLNPSFTFSNFITSKSNRFACSLVLKAAYNPAEYYNPLYFFGNLSCGKTHLLNAFGNQILDNDPSVKIINIPLEQLSSDFSFAFKNRDFTKFREKYRNAEILIIDDIHLVSGLLRLQKELITVFNYYYESKKQIVFAGRLPPGRIKSLLPELKSRMEWGLLLELQVPDQKTKMKIIKKKAKEEKIPLPDDVAFFLANSIEDLKNITKQLITIGTYSSIKHSNIGSVKFFV